MNAIALPRTALMRYLDCLAEEVVSLQSRTTQVSNDPKKLEYVQHYSDERHRFAAYCIDAVPGSLGRRGSVASEQNHSSVSAHLGDHIFEPEAQVASLLTRQSELSAKKQTRDQKYSHSTRIAITSLLEVARKRDELAMSTLAALPFKKYWIEKVVSEAKHYHATPNPDGSYRVQRHGASAESARIICESDRCSCNDRVRYLIQCHHEFCVDGDFKAEKFDNRHWQPSVLPLDYFRYVDGVAAPIVEDRIAPMDDAPDEESDDTINQDAPCYDAVNDAGAVAAGFADGDHSGASDLVGAVTKEAANTVMPVPMRDKDADLATTNNVAPPQKKRRISYRELSDASKELCNLTSRALPEIGEAIYGSILGLVHVVRNCKSVSGVNDAIARAVIGRTSWAEITIGAPSSDKAPPLTCPVPVPGASQLGGRHQSIRLQSHATTAMVGRQPGPRSGGAKPNQCGFCMATGHQRPSCAKLRSLGGNLLKTSELTGIINRLNTVSYASELEGGVVTLSLPLLDSLPMHTGWLVLHKQCFIDHTLLEEAKLRPDNLGVIVSCIDKHNGSVFERIFGRFARASVVGTWINKYGAPNRSTHSKVISRLVMHPTVPLFLVQSQAIASAST
jgi:hypothetical protein